VTGLILQFAAPEQQAV